LETKAVRRPIHLLWGSLALLLGAYSGYLAARTIYITGRALFVLHCNIATREWIWFSATVLPISAAAAFFVWLAARQLHRASGQPAIPPNVRWGRFVLGFCITFVDLKTHFDPGSNTLRPDNAEQASAMLATGVVFFLVGIALMCFAFVPKSPKKEMPGETLVR
jgi:hypothetical protein